MTRPSVSLIVPFAGSPAQRARVLAALQRVTLRQGDEMILADNSPHAVTAPAGAVHVIAATGTRAPGFARNCAARIAHGEWLVFLDADTQPSPTLLDDYFDPTPRDTTAILAGGIVDVAERGTLAARHAVARGHMSETATLERPRDPYAQTANCAIRRDAFDLVGGFDETVRAGEDADLCFRLVRAGFGLEQRPHASVAHISRATVAASLAQLSVHGSGAAWLNRRYPGSFPPPRARALSRRLAHDLRSALAAARRGEREAAAFALLDLVGACAFESGRLRPNRARTVSVARSAGNTRDERMRP